MAPKRGSSPWNKGTGEGEVRVCKAPGCGQEFYATPIAIRRGQGKFCSRACAYRNRPKVSAERVEKQRRSMLALDRTGERNPGFRHGRRTGLNIRGWDARHKGETCCRACGGTDGRLALHHAVPRSVCPPDARRDLRNGITLCPSCHLSWHRGGLKLTRDIFTAEEWSYISSLELTGRSIDGWLDKHYPIRAAA